MSRLQDKLEELGYSFTGAPNHRHGIWTPGKHPRVRGGKFARKGPVDAQAFGIQRHDLLRGDHADDIAHPHGAIAYALEGLGRMDPKAAALHKKFRAGQWTEADADEAEKVLRRASLNAGAHGSDNVFFDDEGQSGMEKTWAESAIRALHTGKPTKMGQVIPDRGEAYWKKRRSRLKEALARLDADLNEGIFDRFKHPHDRRGRWASSPRRYKDADLPSSFFALTGFPLGSTLVDESGQQWQHVETHGHDTHEMKKVGPTKYGQPGISKKFSTDEVMRMVSLADAKRPRPTSDDPAEDDALEMWLGPPSAQDIAWRRSDLGKKSRGA